MMYMLCVYTCAYVCAVRFFGGAQADSRRGADALSDGEGAAGSVLFEGDSTILSLNL